MYRCTECNAEYEEAPRYCKCGNDEFEEIIYDEIVNNDEYDDVDEELKERKLTKKERLELKQQEEEKNKSLIVVGVTLILCFLVLLLPPHREKKEISSKKKNVQQVTKLPSVSTFWIDELPSAYKKDDPMATLPLLNERFGSISPKLREYLLLIGRSLNARWNSSFVEGVGNCKVQFVLNKEGELETKNIVSSSGNKSLDDSVLLLLSKTIGFATPPDDYRGEKVYILFTVEKKGVTKVTYPSR